MNGHFNYYIDYDSSTYWSVNSLKKVPNRCSEGEVKFTNTRWITSFSEKKEQIFNPLSRNLHQKPSPFPVMEDENTTVRNPHQLANSSRIECGIQNDSYALELNCNTTRSLQNNTQWQLKGWTEVDQRSEKKDWMSDWKRTEQDFKSTLWILTRPTNNV